MRAALVRLASDDHVLLDTWHHSVFDGWSPKPFFRDLIELYLARLAGRQPRLPDLPIQYADYAAWHRGWLVGPRLERGLAYWREQLAGLGSDELPLDRPRPAVQTYTGDLVTFTVDADVADQVRDFSRQQGVTMFVTMLAVVDTLIHRWTTRTDVVVGVGTSGRYNPATHELIGYFNNVLPFRTRVRGDESFRELVRRCATTVAGVLDHEWVPLPRIVSALCRRRDPGRHPLYDIAYTHQNAPTPVAALPGVELSPFEVGTLGGIPPGTAKFDLTLGVTDQDEGVMHAYVEYATQLFDRSTMEQLAGWFETLIRTTAAEPDRPVDRLPLPGRQALTGRQALPGDRGALRGPAREWGHQSAVQLVQQRVAARPEHPAVVCAGRTYSYREINRRANRLARHLIANGVTAEVTVPVVAGRDVNLVVGWIAVAKAGGAYVPIDPAVPAARLDGLLSEVGARIAVVSPELAGLVDAVPRRIVIEDRDQDGGQDDDQNPPPRSGSRNLAYVTYTSGSTGRPQGCAIEHGGLANLLRWYQAECRLSDKDNLSQLSSPGFDAAVLEIWAGLCWGGTVHIAQTPHQEPAALLRWIAEHRITVAMLPTPLAEILLTESALPADLPLRVVCTGGDRLRARPPAGAPFRLLNLYGPTECTVLATAGSVPAARQDVLPDIGRPIANTQVYLLDGRGEQVPPGEVGELFIGGAATGRGYHRLAATTAARFVADPFASEPGARMYRTGDLARLRPDQTIEFCGRSDDQVEIRGHRVEPAEIERTLVAHPDVREAVVVATLGPGGSPRLTAHVAGGPPAPAEPDLLRWVAHALPAYLVPSRVLVRDHLPRTPNGKLDRNALKAMVTSMAAPTRTGTDGGEAERVLAGIWAELLGRDQVSPDDNFFELGGDSVTGIRVVARAARAGVHLTPQQLLRYRTLRELARVAEVSDPATPDHPAIAATGPVTAASPPARLTPIMHRFVMPGGHRFGSFVVPLVLETAPGPDGDAVLAAIRQLVTVHEPLRYRLRGNSLGWRIECVDTEPAKIADVKILPPMTGEDELTLLESDLARLRSEVDVERGPMLRARYYHRSRHHSGLILLVIHHAVADNTSILTILDDLDAALADLAAGRSLATAPRPAAWREWAEHLHHMSLSDELAGELDYWSSILGGGNALAGARPDHPGDPGVVIRTIEPSQLPAALRQGGPAGREAVYCAVACGLARWQGTPGAYVMTEGDGVPNRYRPETHASVLGWFTTLHPLLLPVDPTASAPDCLDTIADRIRSVPHDGVGYGILRHLSPDSPPVASLRALPEPDILINHLATDTTSFDRGYQRLRHRSDLNLRLRRAETSDFRIVLSTWLQEGSFSLAVAHDRRLDAGGATALADHLVAALDELV
jgi:amino acid adenylation domain-containing protein